jgi:hypothetical protein
MNNSDRPGRVAPPYAGYNKCAPHPSLAISEWRRNTGAPSRVDPTPQDFQASDARSGKLATLAAEKAARRKALTAKRAARARKS